MKNVLLVAIFLFAHAAMAVPGRALNRADARAHVERAPEYTELAELNRRPLRERTMTPALRGRLESLLNTSFEGVVPLTSATRNGMIRMMNLKPSETLTEIIHLSTTARNGSSASIKANAQKALELIALASVQLPATISSNAQLRAYETMASNIISTNTKIANLSFGEASQSFVTRYTQLLQQGRTMEQAISEASQGRFTEAELRECT